MKHLKESIADQISKIDQIEDVDPGFMFMRHIVWEVSMMLATAIGRNADKISQLATGVGVGDHDPYTGLRCPACGSFDIRQDDTLNHGALCTVQSWCADCDANWTATYLFDQIENLTVPELTDETEA